MLVYLILVAYILIGQLLLNSKILSRTVYCSTVCMLLILITGLRDANVGMWDTVSVYLPSFRVISSNSIAKVVTMGDTQYKFIGFVIYSKLISFISTNDNFYIFMMAWPFYVCVTYLIKKWSSKPGYSFMVLLGLGFFTYSFSMIRGMLALAFAALAIDAAIEDKWRRFLFLVVLGTSFHFTALAMVLLYPIKKIRWSTAKIMTILILLMVFRKGIPFLWKGFVTTFIRGVLPTYNYYGSKGGELADAMLILYIMIGFVALVKLWLSKKGRLRLTIKAPVYKINIGRTNKATVLDSDFRNMLLGMTVVGSIVIYMTVVLAEMLRIAMFFSLGSALLMGNADNGDAIVKNKKVIQFAELGQVAMLLIYFLAAALPNMNVLPYRFFFQ